MNAMRRCLRSPLLLVLLLAGLALLYPAHSVLSLDEEGLDLGDAFGPPELPVRIEALASPLVAGETVHLAVIYSVPPETHLTDAFFTVEFASEPALVFAEPVYPEPILEGDDKLYRGEVPVWTTVTLPADPGGLTFTAKAEYQICSEGEVEMCFPPEEATPALSASVLPAGSPWQVRSVAGLDLPASGAPGAATDTGEKVASTGTEAPTDLAGRLEHALARGSWFAFLIIFLGGVLTSFTPCVYPVIPITISYIGGSSEGNPFKGFVLSLWFVLGIAITYSALGLLAAGTGAAFGQATQNAWVSGSIAVLIGAMGLSMAGFFDIQLPSSLTSKVGGRHGGFLGPILMGFATGLIAAPCVGPVLIVLLTWVATTGNLLLGFWMLFTFALGLGLLFIVLGTFSGAITALPGAGAWMEGVKHFFALLLFGLAFWFLRAILPGWLLTMLYGLVLVMALGAWGAFHPLPEGASGRQGLLKGLMLLFWIVGAFLAIGGGLKGFAPDLLPTGGTQVTGGVAIHQEPDWIWDADEGFREAAASGMPVMMDFWAEWCVACKELDHKSYNQPEVLALAESFTSIKMDMTEKSPTNEAILKDYAVLGMPTVIFFDSSGKELERFSGFKKAEELAAYMERALSKHNG